MLINLINYAKIKAIYSNFSKVLTDFMYKNKLKYNVDKFVAWSLYSSIDKFNNLFT